MKTETASILLSLACMLSPLDGPGWTFRRSFRGGYPVAPAMQAKSADAKTKAPRRLTGTAKCTGASPDRIKVVGSDGEHTVRLDKITAPPASCAEARKAAVEMLRELVDGREVQVLWTEKKQGEIVGVVYCRHPRGMVEVNLTLVKNGLAGHSTKDKTAEYDSADRDARKNRRGMWSAK